jgi:hypothetical protein
MRKWFLNFVRTGTTRDIVALGFDSRWRYLETPVAAGFFDAHGDAVALAGSANVAALDLTRLCAACGSGALRDARHRPARPIDPTGWDKFAAA